MTRCQHCKKLTHSENLIVEYDSKDHDKVFELASLEGWVPFYMYNRDYLQITNEYGKLKCGDIWIHFRGKLPDNE